MKRSALNVAIGSLLVLGILTTHSSAFAQAEGYEDGDAVFSTTPQPPMSKEEAPPVWEPLGNGEPGVLTQPFQNFDPIRQLRPELLQYFKWVMVVNKAPRGTSAQTLKIYDISSGQSNLVYDFLISTGREDSGQNTPTPTGLFTLDPERFVPWPSRYANPDMKWAMYWDYEYTSRKSGFALHAAPPGTEPKLGRRASHGCIRMRYDDVNYLHQFIKNNLAGWVPRFVFDHSAGRTNRTGEMRLGADGRPELRWGYQVLLVIIDQAD